MLKKISDWKLSCSGIRGKHWLLSAGKNIDIFKLHHIFKQLFLFLS